MKFPYKATIIILICACLLLGIYSFFDQVFGGVKKQIAVSGSIEDLIKTEGFIMKDELVIADNSGSVIDSMIADGERVSKGQQVASSYSSSVDADVKAELKSLNERIMSLEKNASQNKILGNDSVKSEALVKSKMGDIIKYSHKGQALHLSEIKSELETVIDKKLSDDKNESVLENEAYFIKTLQPFIINACKKQNTQVNIAQVRFIDTCISQEYFTERNWAS